jgi:hypothetical protein
MQKKALKEIQLFFSFIFYITGYTDKKQSQE